MLNLKMHLGNGESLDLPFPQNAREWPIKNYIKYIVKMEQYNEWLAKSDTLTLEPMNYQYQAIVHKAKAISAFFDLPANKFYEIIVKEELDDDSITDLNLLGDTIQNFCASIQIANLDVFTNRYTFEFQGKKYYIDPILVKGLSGINQLDIKLGQLIEIMEKRRLVAQHKSLKVPDPNDPTKKIFGDPEGSLRYSNLILNIAALSKEEGEEEINDPDMFDQLVEEKRVLFKDIDIQTAMDVDFFLSVTLSI